MATAIENLELSCGDRKGGPDCIVAVWPEDVVEAIDLCQGSLSAEEEEKFKSLRAANARHLDVESPVGLLCDDVRLIIAKAKASPQTPSEPDTELETA